MKESKQPSIVDLAQKQRMNYLITKIKNYEVLTVKEINELKFYEKLYGTPKKTNSTT